MDRHAEGRRIESERPIDMFLLDDGFQHPQLARAVDIVLVDLGRAARNFTPAGAGWRGVMSRGRVVPFTRVNQAHVRCRPSKFPA
jgi:tetraacyldisaccharide-1-P 4'-kinase